MQRKKLGFEKKDTILTYVAEISKRKNQNLLIDIMKQVVSTNDRVKLLLLGDGEYFEFIRKKVNDYNLQDNVSLLGYKTNVVDYLQISDIYIYLHHFKKVCLSMLLKHNFVNYHVL